jgi:hypothetical protein
VIDIEWEMTFGGNGDDRGTAIIQSADSGFVVVGYSNSFDGDITSPKGNQDFWVTKLDSIGNLEWQKSYGGNAADWCHDICIGTNDGYLLVGQSNSIDGDITENKGAYDIWIVKINNVGDIEWQKTFGGTQSENCRSVIQTSDGNYMIIGYTLSNDGDILSNHGSADIWVIKISEFGSIIWQKTFGSSQSDNAQEIIEDISGKFYIIGNSAGWDGDVGGNNGFDDYWVIKIDDAGGIIWESTFGGSETDIGKSVALKENGIICVGQTYSEDDDIEGFHGLLDAWVVAIDSSGNLEWQKPYGGTGGDEAYSITKVSNNEFVFSGRSSTANGDVSENKGGVDYWVVSLDTLGNIIWQKSIGGTNNEESFDIVGTIDSHLVVTGYSASSDLDVSPTYLFNNFWVAKLEKCENVFYLDNDNDGFGNLIFDSVACEIPMGYVLNNNDCDDNNNLINPATIEICNTLDDNCNLLSDEDLVFITYYLDADLDNFGDAETDTTWCSIITGYVVDSTDCNDTDPAIHPGATEILNGIDDDCNQIADDGLEIIETEWIGLSVFPSPATNELTIQFENINTPLLTIYNINGDLIFQQNKIQSPFNFDASELSAGLYLIYLYAGNLYATTVFVKD